MDLDNFRKYHPKHILRISIVTITLKDVIQEMTRVLLSPSQSNIIQNYSASNCIIHRWRELTSPHIGSHSHGWIPTSAVYHCIVRCNNRTLLDPRIQNPLLKMKLACACLELSETKNLNDSLGFEYCTLFTINQQLY